jgi:hypothetical protein
MRNKESYASLFFDSFGVTTIQWSEIITGISEQINHIESETIMNTKLLLPLLIATTLAAAGAGAGAAEQPASFRGNAAPAQAPVDQVIVLTDATRHVNVTGGQTVRFVVGDRSFTWCFQNGSAHVVPFDLEQIAPQGVLNHRVTAYVDDNPLYRNS